MRRGMRRTEPVSVTSPERRDLRARKTEACDTCDLHQSVVQTAGPAYQMMRALMNKVRGGVEIAPYWLMLTRGLYTPALPQSMAYWS